MRAPEDHLTISIKTVPTKHRAVHSKPRCEQSQSTGMVQLSAVEIEDLADLRGDGGVPRPPPRSRP